MEILTVKPEMIEETSAFATQVFIDYYTPLIGQKQSEYMTDLFLSAQAIEDLINDGAVFRQVRINDKLVGFCEYKIDGDRLFLSKLYADKKHRGMGLGSFMFEDVVDYAKKNGLNKIYLTVNKGNTPSYNIYDHFGFKVIDSVETDIGSGYIMDDYIMEYEVQ